MRGGGRPDEPLQQTVSRGSLVCQCSGCVSLLLLWWLPKTAFGALPQILPLQPDHMRCDFQLQANDLFQSAPGCTTLSEKGW